MEFNSVIQAFSDVASWGEISKPRDLLIKEIPFYSITVNQPFHSFTFRPRDNLAYIKKEFMWYLKGDPYDNSICDEASIWKTIVQPDGRIFSNYGYYWFIRKDADGLTDFDRVVKTLIEDPDSRRAYIPMLGHEHMFADNKDVVCTKGITFRIVQGELIMHADMRSSDLAIGSSIDWPCFWWLHEMMSHELGVPKGQFIFSTDSLHVYENYWPYMNEVAACEGDGFLEVEYPPITDVHDLLSLTFKSDFGKWLKS